MDWKCYEDCGGYGEKQNLLKELNMKLMLSYTARKSFLVGVEVQFLVGEQLIIDCSSVNAKLKLLLSFYKCTLLNRYSY